MLKEIFVGVAVAVVTGSIIAAAGYFLIIEKNQLTIGNLQSELAELKLMGLDTQKSLNSTKLFIAQAHPDRDISTLSSLNKLKKLSKSEIESLAAGITFKSVGFDDETHYKHGVITSAELNDSNNDLQAILSKKIHRIETDYAEVVKEHNLNDDDLAVYTRVTETDNTVPITIFVE